MRLFQASNLPSILKSFLQVKSLSVCISMLCAVQIAQANAYWDEFGELPVSIQQVSNGNVQVLEFQRFEDSMLVAELPGGVGVISLPVNENLVRNLRLELKSLSKVPSLLDRENFTGALELLRPAVYPLVKFHPVPASFVQIHTPVYNLLETLYLAREYDELEFLLGKIKLDQTTPRYSNFALTLMNARIQRGEYVEAASIAKMIPVEGKYSSNIKPLIDASDNLRAAGMYEAVIPIYRSIETTVPDDLKESIRMWLAYSLALNGQVVESAELFERISEPAPKNRLFSLYKLLQGSSNYRENNYSEALDLLTRGFVRAQASYSWVPEMLFLIGDCYLKSSDPIAARNVWTEVVTLYPQSPWASRAEAMIESISPNEISNNEQ